MDTKLSGGKALAQTVGIAAPGLARVARRAEGGRTAPELEVRSAEPRLSADGAQREKRSP